MKTAVLYLTVLGCAVATPNGYYHQEYNYKTSASSYKNNELQHKTDDQGYFRKDGDLEGRVKPKVDANSEHSEYINPNLRNGDYHTGVIGGANDDMSSYGHMRADLGAYRQNLAAEGLAHSDNISGKRSYSDYSSGSSYGANSYGSSSQSYGISSNLRSVTSRLQQELERELQEAVQENRAYAHLGVDELERELRRNLTSRLNNELTNRYGQQSIRGGLSYTISGGHLQSTANYDNQELQDLQRQMENSLLNQLKSQYSQSYGSSSSSSHYQQGSSHSNIGYASTTVRPVYYNHNPYPEVTFRPITTIRTTYPVDYTNYVHYTPIHNPESITNIASRVQSNLDIRLNELLQDAETKYFSSSSAYSLTNTDVVLESMRRDLRNNITYLLNEDIKRNYGNQVPRDGYMYTLGPNGETSSQSNYAIRDLENLRSQIERNLIEKLNREFERHRSRWSSKQSYSQSSQSISNYNNYNTPRYDIYSTPRYDIYSTPRYGSNYNAYDSEVEHLSTRPTSPHITPLITSGGGSTNQIYQSSQSDFAAHGASGSSISQLQRQLQQDLSRQLQAAISRGHYGSYSSSSGSYNPQSYQVSLQQLTDELNRNLTRQLQEYSASGYYSAHGNFDQAQLASLRSRLQNDLMSQLQQGLQQSFHSSSSYSASSSSGSSSNGNYRPVRGSQNYQLGQYRTGGSMATMQGEDCNGDDHSAYISHRMKRNIQPYRSQPLGLGYGGGNSGYSSNYGYGNTHRSQGGGYGRSSYGINRQQEIGQQVEDDVEELGQQVDESDLTQQVEDDEFGRLQSGSHARQEFEVGQQVDDSDLTQQVEDDEFGRLQSGSHRRQEFQVGQQVDDSDLTQQVEDDGFGRLQSGSHRSQEFQVGQQVDDSDLTQQVEDDGFVKLQLGSQNQNNHHGQYEDNADLSQQQETSDLSQKVEHVASEQVNSQSQRVGHQGSLTEQREDNINTGSLHIGSQTQQQILNQQQIQSAKQLEEELSKQLQEAIQNQKQSITYSSSSSSTPQSYQVSLQQLSNELSRNLSKQLQELSSGRHGASYSYSFLGNLNEQQLAELKAKLHSDLTNQLQKGLQQSYYYSVSWNNRGPNDHHQVINHQTDEVSQTYRNNLEQFQTGIFQDFNQNQVQVTQQLKDTLSKQLKDAVETYYTTFSVSHDTHDTQSAVIYQQLVNELQRNLTRKLQAVGPSSNNYSYVFNKQQIITLQKQLENDLKLQLQKEISTITSNSPKNLVKSTSEVDDIELTQQIQNNPFEDQDNFELVEQVEENTFRIPEAGNQQLDKSANNHVDIPISVNQWNIEDLNKIQLQFADQLKDDLSNQLKNAVQAEYYSAANYGSSKPQAEIFYQQLVNELQKNITKLLQDIRYRQNNGQYSYATYYSFNEQQLASLKTQLEYQLKLQLQHEVSLYFKQWGDRTKVELEAPQQNVQKQEGIQQSENSFNQNYVSPGSQPGNLPLGSQQVGHPFNQNQEDLTQQTQDAEFETPHSEDISGYDQHLSTQDNLQLTQQVEPNRHIDNAGLRQPQIASSNLYLYNRPVTQKPVRSNSFIQSEIRENSNQHIFEQQLNLNHERNNLATANQVVEQQRPDVTVIDEYDTEPSGVQPLTVPKNNIDDSTQQQIYLHQQATDYLPHLITNTNENNNNNKVETSEPSQTSLIRNQNVNGEQTATGQSFGVTSQGQFIGQHQSLADAEKDADLLIERLRAAQRNRVRQPDSSQTFRVANQPVTDSQLQRQRGYGHLENPDSQTSVQVPVQDTFNQNQQYFGVYLNKQQRQLAKQLEKDLSKQLEDAVKEHYYSITYSSSGYSNPQLYTNSYQQLSEQLQKNLTKQLQEILGGAGQHSYSSSYSVYGTFTDEQREKLLNQLETDLSAKLQHNLQESYGLQQQGRQYNTGSTNTYTSLPVEVEGNSYVSRERQAYKPYTDSNHRIGTAGEIHYGHQGEVQQNLESVYESQPIHHHQANVVQNVEPQSNYNSGVKSHRQYGSRRYTGPSLPPPPPPSLVNGVKPPSAELIPPPPPPPSLVNGVKPPSAELIPPPRPDGIPPPGPEGLLPPGSGLLPPDSEGIPPPGAEAIPQVIPHPVPPPGEPPQDISQENLPWWKRIGNKVKTGAQHFKEKIIG